MDEENLIRCLEDLAPSDFSRILARLPETVNHIPDNASHHERVVALLRYIRSSAGPGLGQLVAVMASLFPRLDLPSGSIHSVINTPIIERAMGRFKNYIPKAYLNNLPFLLYKAYSKAHQYWDTGITLEMRQGNAVLTEALCKILYQLAETVYENDFFEGKTVEAYYEDVFGRLSKASHEAHKDGGSIGLLMMGANYSSMIEETIIHIVKDVDDPAHFARWKAKWDEAITLANEGQDADVYDLTV